MAIFGRAMEVEELLHAGAYEEAISRAERLLEEIGNDPLLVAAWSYSILYATSTGHEISWPQRELAVRMYLTILEEFGQPPAGLDSSGAYEMLSLFLAELGDPVSAYTAASLARARIEESNGHSDPGAVERLNELVDSLSFGDQSRRLAVESSKKGPSTAPVHSLNSRRHHPLDLAATGGRRRLLLTGVTLEGCPLS